MKQYVMLKGSWGHDSRFVKGFEFDRDEVPESYQFDAGLRKGTFAPIDNPDMVDPETGLLTDHIDADGNLVRSRFDAAPGQLTEQVIRTDGNDNKTEADVEHAAGTDSEPENKRKKHKDSDAAD